jgi:Flp pilus assembly protein TadD
VPRQGSAGLLAAVFEIAIMAMFPRTIWVLAAASLWFPLPSRSQGTECAQATDDCAVSYIRHRNFQAAIRSLNEELRQFPKNPTALNLLGIALTESGQTEQANGKFREALTVNPHFYAARKNLAVNEFNSQNFAEAETQFQRVLRDAPGDQVAHIYLAEIRFRKDDFAAAVKYYERGRSRLRQNPTWLLHYAQSLLANNDTDQAKAALQSLPADDAEDRFQAGMILGRAGAYAAAADFFASARAKYSNPDIAAYNHLLMLNQAHEWTKAIQLFQELTAEAQQHAELYNLVSESYVKTGQVQEAYDVLRKATQIDPTAEDNYVDLAALCLEYEEFSLGLDILNVGIHYIPDSYRLYIQRGVTLVMKGSVEDAEKDFQTASQIAPDKSLPYFALGEVWMQSGNTDKAVSVLRERNKRGGDFLIPYIFGVALIRAGAEPGTPAADEAVSALRSSILRNGSFSHSHAELGKLLFKQGDTDAAIRELRAASALDPDDAGPVYVLAQAYRKRGEKSQADSLLAQVTRLHSEEHKLDLKKELKRLVRQDTVSSSQETQAIR